jgi:hypothetical protein
MNRHFTRRGSCLLFVLLLCLVGCSSGDGIRRGAVEGTVSLADSPIADGLIRFIPTGGTTGAMVDAPIKAGSFTLPQKSGPCIGSQRVEIFAFQKTGKMVVEDGEEMEEIKQLVPSRYNTRSELTVTIQEGKNLLPPFELTVKKKEGRGISQPRLDP